MAVSDDNIQNVLDRIAIAVSESGRKICDNQNVTTAIQELNACKLNLQRISSVIAADTFQTINSAIDEMLQLSGQTEHTSSNVQLPLSPTTNAPEHPVPTRGRPRKDITDTQMRSLFNQGLTAAAMAECLGCSVSYIYGRLYNMGLKMRDRYANVTDADLNWHVSELHTQFPNCGVELLSGYLRSNGLRVQRARIRRVLVASDPAAAASRWSNTVARRSYRVSAPNSLWHIDSHLKLVRWGFYTHAGIDGYSRMIVYLCCSTSNRAQDVLAGFATACETYSVPSRVRSDCGGENVLVGLLMTILRGSHRGSFITGRSIHNQRIERLWRDVHKEVTQPLYTKFYDMEDAGKLQPDNELHRYALHTVFLPLINQKLTRFASAWNMHRIRTAHNKTPNQLWIEGLLHAADAGPATVVAELNDSRENLLDRLTNRLTELGVDTSAVDAEACPAPSFILTTEQQQQLHQTVESVSDIDMKFDVCCTKLIEFDISL